VIHFFDATSATWQHICDAIRAFHAWREQHSGYCYIHAHEPLRSEIARLCAFLDLDDAYCFADELLDMPDVRWSDLSELWQPTRD